MKKRTKNLFSFAFALVLCFVFAVPSFALLPVPALTSPVVDNASIISAGTESRLVQTLQNLSDKTGMQLAVLTIPSLEDESLEVYSLRVVGKWGLGKKGEDTGVLLLVALAERAVRIEVGYGLEGSLTDAKCGIIIRNIIVPNFRNGDYDKGISEAVNNIIGVITEDESLVSEEVINGEEETEDGWKGLLSFIFFVIVIGILLSTKTGRRILFFAMLTGGRSGGRSSGGFGGGGFSGGGGHFGGGGASGHW